MAHREMIFEIDSDVYTLAKTTAELKPEDFRYCIVLKSFLSRFNYSKDVIIVLVIEILVQNALCVTVILKCLNRNST